MGGNGTFGPMAPGNHPTVALVVDGAPVEVPDVGGTLLDALRDHAGVRSAKDGCSPQGQCGCCTVLVDGQARVACVTPLRRVTGRSITTAGALPDADRWGSALCATGGSQCGFCTPGIAVRLSALAAGGAASAEDGGVAACERALLAHLCRCTGWKPVLDAWQLATTAGPGRPIDPWAGRDGAAAEARAALETGGPQAVSAEAALGGAPFAADTAPDDALVAVPDGAGGWVLDASLAEARAAAGKVQGRRSTVDAGPPLELPPGDWAVTLRTSWCEPGYLETDASWCAPGGEPASPLANGGAFGAKRSSPLPEAARRLADEHDRPVLVLWSREDVVRHGAKRPPLAVGVDADGRGIVRVARTPGIADAIRSFAGLAVDETPTPHQPPSGDPIGGRTAAAQQRRRLDLTVEEVDLAGPLTSADLRAAGWAEVALLAAALAGDPQVTVTDPTTGGRATARLEDGTVHLRVEAGEVLDDVVLRSYCTGAAHQALGWVTSEGLAVASDGEVLDLTIRSFGILRAVDTPPIEVEVVPGPPGAPAVRVGDAAFAAVAAATWVAQGCPPDLPTRIGARP
jgi:aerobic-type carbon monoxide dehydrogenase small subunit (CoxS/CutS family)